MYPRAEGGPHSIMASAASWGLGVGCGSVFLRRGFGFSAFAVVSFALGAGSRPVLVLVAPREGGFVCLNVGSRFVLVFVLRVWCLFAFGVGRSARMRGFVSLRSWLAFDVGDGPSRAALVLVVLRLRCFSSVPWLGASYCSAQAENWKARVVNYLCVNSALRIPAVEIGRSAL